MVLNAQRATSPNESKCDKLRNLTRNPYAFLAISIISIVTGIILAATSILFKDFFNEYFRQDRNHVKDSVHNTLKTLVMLLDIKVSPEVTIYDTRYKSTSHGYMSTTHRYTSTTQGYTITSSDTTTYQSTTAGHKSRFIACTESSQMGSDSNFHVTKKLSKSVRIWDTFGYVI